MSLSAIQPAASAMPLNTSQRRLHDGRALQQRTAVNPSSGRQTERSASPDKSVAAAAPTDKPSLREAFDDFVGQTFYGQMLASMRKSVGEPAYFHGGRAEEVFQGQLDQILAEKMSDATADQLTGPMFDLFNMPRA